MSLQESPNETPRINPWTIWVPVILIAMGIVVFYNYLIYNSLEAEKTKGKVGELAPQTERPAYLSRLEKDLELTERNGQTVHLAELRGKILVASWVFTRCPRGCAGVVAKLKQLYGELGGNPDVQFLSFTLDPEDTPEMMKSFASGIDIKDADHWWFLNGPKDDVRKYLTLSFKFRPVQDLPLADRLTPDDKYIHDLRVCLVDHLGHIRGLYDVMNADPEYQKYWDQKIRQDLKVLIEEKQNNPIKQ